MWRWSVLNYVNGVSAQYDRWEIQRVRTGAPVRAGYWVRHLDTLEWLGRFDTETDAIAAIEDAQGGG
jgi:hypothetical protein